MTDRHVITELWIWVTTEADGSEGILAASGLVLPEHFTPLMSSKRHVAEGLGAVAEVLCATTGRPRPRLLHMKLAESVH